MSMTDAELKQKLDSLTSNSWNEDASGMNFGAPITLTVTFLNPSALPQYMINQTGDPKNYLLTNYGRNFDQATALTASQQAAALEALKSWSDVANINFTGQRTDGLYTITLGGLRFRSGDTRLASTASLPINPSPNGFFSQSRNAGDIFLNTGHASVSATTAAGDATFNALLHEIGHALGLKHPTNQEPGDERPWFNSSQWNSTRYTVMAYKNLFGDSGPRPFAPMLLDIAAIQRLYGANENTNTGDNFYRFKTEGGWPIQAIWDAGGNDTIDGTDQTKGLHIDLSQGGESYVKGLFGSRGEEIHIAYAPQLGNGTIDVRFAFNYIENAIGGSGDDEINGNDGVNVLEGGQGDDTLSAGLGNDTLEGGENNDKLNGGIGEDTYIYYIGDGKDIITDFDGGTININGVALTGTAVRTIDENKKARPAWQLDFGGSPLVLTLISGDLGHSGTLQITGSQLGAGGSITINNFFNTGSFGFTLNPENSIESVNGSSLAENSSSTITIKLSGIASAGDRLQLSTSGLDGLKGIFGAQTLSLDGDGVSIDLTEGQSELVFALLSEGDVDTSTQITVTASLFDAEGHEQGESSALNVSFTATEELGTTRTIVGDIKIKDFEPDEEGVQPHLDSLGNRITSGEVDLIQDDLNGSAGADTIIGGAGGDILKGRGGDDVIFAEASVDVNAAIAAGAIGLGNPDLLVMSGAAGNDFLSGNGGNDTLVGTGGAEVLAGGAGNDLIVAGQGDDFLDGDAEMSVSTFNWTFNWTFTETNNNGYLYNLTGDGSSFVVNPSGSGDDTLYAGGGNDVVGAGFGNDLAFGEDGDDKIWGDGGRDTLLGGDGDDKIYGDVGWVTTDNPANDAADFIDGGAGNDELHGDGGSDVIFGGVGNDALVGDRDDQHSGDDYLDGEDGDDTLFGSGGADTLIGGNGNDKLYGDSADTGEEFRGNDYLDGGAGDDLLLGDGGADVLIGGTGDDLLYGEASDTPESVIGADYLDGGEGNDIVVGAGGSDTLYGGDGNDQLVGDGNNTPSGYEGDDYLDGGAGNDLLFGGGGADTLIGGDGDDQLAGESGDTAAEAHGDDHLDGGAGNDVLIGAGGADTLIGGAGNDSLYGEAGDTPLEVQGDDLLDGGDGDDTLVGAGGADILFGGAGNDTLFGDSSATAAELQLGDYLDGGDGDDVISGSGGDDTLVGGDGNDRLFGGAGADTLYGGDGNDTLYFGEGGDTLSGGAGDDNYYFQIPAAWFDYGYFTDIPEVHIQDWDQDTASGNSLTFGFSFAGSGLYLGVGSLTLNFTQYPGLVVHIDGFDQFDPYGSEVISRFIFGDRILSYEDILALGFDFQGTPDVDTLVGTGADDRIQALASDDILYGAGGNDLLDGGTGADEMLGGEGNDTYLVDDVGDSVIELEAEGTDLVESSITYTLTDNVENLTLTGTEALSGAGNQLSNVITGNDADNTLLGLGGNDTLVGNGGNDRLDGGEGADIMIGGAGDDVYIVDNASDSITENAGEGLDRVESSASYTLGTNVENLLLTGTNAINGSGNDLANEIVGNDANNVLNGAGGNDTLIGNGGADALNGGAGNDTLSGGAGNDTLSGGAGTNTLSGGTGDDVYLIDGAGIDTIVELANEGTDRVDASVTHTLVGSVENLTLTGGAAIAGTGNALDNVIRGNSSHNSLYGLAGTDQLLGGAGDDVLDGGEGADRLEGGTGNDTYIVDNAADQVIETTSNDFNDRLQASVSYTLANSARIEHFVLTGGDAINATGNASVWDYVGNEADNIITDFGSASQYGNGGNDTLIATGDYSNNLDGGEGIDTMRGGNGSDTYVVDHAADVVIENLDEGYDEVESSVTYTLSANVERLLLIEGAGDIDGTGNEIANDIQGNEGNNALLGLQGEDWLYGGEGDDTLDGGADDDYLYGGFGSDVIFGGAGDDYVYDTEGENVLSGGAGDDLYYVGDNYGQDSSHSVVIEQANEGYDVVHSTVSFTLGDNVETLYIDDPFFGFSPYTFRAGTGNDLANTIYGSNARNTLTGLGGNDSIDGRAGNDEIHGNEGDDVLYGGDDNSFAGGEGSADGYLENDDLIDGGAGNDNIDGGSGDDTLLGDEGDDSLFGGQDDHSFGGGFGGGEGYGYGYGYGYPLTNNDYLDGGAGDDILDGGSGNDTLFGGDGVDHLYGGSDGSINYENDDVLDGGAALDTMEGGSGNDTYYVDGTYIEVPDPDALDGCGDPIPGATKRSWTTDTIIEGAEAGYDVVYSTASIVLPGNFEEVHLVGEDNIDATGSSGDEYLGGNSGNNRLDGGGGADYLAGLAGDDTYVINDDLDYIDEAVDGGNDTVIASFDYDLSVNVENVENLTLAGSAITAIGNDGDNTLIGNAEDNVLSGGGGNDTLNGGAGNDLLMGGAGDDTYKFTRGSGVDVVDDIEGLNRVHLLTDSLTEADITITQSGDDLILSINDTTDQLTLRGWNAIPELRTGSIELCDGTVIGTEHPNTAPTPLADSSTVIEDQLQVVTGNVLGNDSDAETASLLSVLNPGTYTNEYGTLVLDADGDYAFTLNNAFVQSMQAGERRSAIAMSYVVSDNDPRGGLTSTATLSIDVRGTNDGPVAVSDTNSVSEDAVLVATGNVLANDTDVDTDTVLSVSSPATLAGTYGTLTLGADGQYSYALNNSAAIVQQLRGGQGVQDVFNYAATDGIEQAAASLVINVTGANDGPLAVNDMNVASEDGTLTATGNVLANDSDPDAGTVLSVSTSGTLVGTYGTATLAADGSYSYSLNNSSALVQSLGQGETVTDVFSYAARDDDSSPLTATAALTINVAGANDAPILVTPVADQSVQAGQAFTLSLPAGTFTDIDRNDSLTYTATLADGTPLPSWLTFDAATQSFGGTRQATSVESYQIRVIATDRFGASTSDDFGLTIAPSGSGVILHFTPECTWPGGTSSLGCIDISGKNKSDLVYEGGPGIDTLLGTDSCDAILLDDKLDECAPDTPARLVSIEIIDAGAGDDVVDLTSNRFSYGDVTVLGGSGADFLVGGAGRNTLRGEDGGDGLFGKGADDVLDGGAGDDHLEGGAGADVMSGGNGNDTFIVESIGDVVAEAEYQGWDQVYSSISYVLTDNVEVLTLEGTADLSATGNALDNQLYGNKGNNVLDGGAGDDWMKGDAGDDVYIVDSIYDGIQENSNRGMDSVFSSVTWTLSSNLENLALTGTDAIDGTGNGLDNVIVGNAGNNVLNGGNGADTLTGGLGDDTFVVNVSGDQVIENSGEGIDTVKSSISYSLGDALENLTLTGSAAIDGVGNAADNLMTGNNANNRLEGGAGNDTLNGSGGDDTMLGGTGNDSYFVNSAADVVIENAGEGIDVVSSSVGGALAANIEVLFLTGSSALSASGNALDNLLRGNGAANVLTGGAGTDILEGGGGADTLSDTIGNTLFNGGAGSDTMTGGAGNDLYIGGAGSDVINTGSGADVILFNRGDGKDTVNASTGADNTLSIGNGILYSDLLFKKSGNNLILLTGSNEQLTFVDWYADANNRSVSRLQVVIEGTSEYDAGSADSMHNKKLETFDFSGLVTAFDAARVANPSLSNWALNSALASRLLGGSDTSAIGGDLAYRYARGATLADVSLTPALGILSDASFGSVPQNFQSLAGLQDPTVRLN